MVVLEHQRADRPPANRPHPSRARNATAARRQRPRRRWRKRTRTEAIETMKNDPTIERLIRWPALDEPGTFIVRCSCQRWSVTGTAREIADASRAHDDSPWRNHITTIYGRVIQPCPNDSAGTATSSTTSTPPTPCAAPAASQQQ